jgi:hypothetical protein
MGSFQASPVKVPTAGKDGWVCWDLTTVITILRL